MSFGLNESDWSLVQSIVIEPLRKHGCAIWIFGSRAKGTFRPFSDLDICYSKKEPFPVGFLPIVKETLQESNLTIKVDLVDWDDMANEYREDVLKHRIKV